MTSSLAIPVAAAGTAAPAVPTVTIEDVDAKLKQQKVKSEAQKSDANGSVQSLHSISDGADGVPGQLPASAAPAIPDWYKIGWREVAGQEAPETDDRDKHLLASFIGDRYFGDWYHNAAVIVVVCTLYTSLGFSLKTLPAGHRRHPLPHTFPVRLGLDLYSYGVLCYLLLDVDSTCPS